jgi:aldehyde:ferredoxin oxidoreductase
MEVYDHIAALLPEGEKRLPKLSVITGKYKDHLRLIKGRYKRRYTSCEGCAGYCRAEIFLNIPGRIHPGLNTALINCTELRWVNDRNWDVPSRHYTYSYPELPKNMPTMDDFEAAVEIVVLGNKYGLNMIEVNEGLLPWLKLCKDEGILSNEELGMTIDMSKGEFWDTLFRKIAYREGVGDILAEHLPRAADIMKKGHRYLAHLANGFSEHHLGRLAHAERFPIWLFTGLAHMTDSRGPVAVLHEVSALNYGRGLPDDQVRALSKKLYGDERSSDKTYDYRKASRVIYHQHRAALLEAMVLCDRVYPLIIDRRVRGGLGDLAAEVKLFSAATGIDMTEQEGHTLGERIVNLERAIMVREGRTRYSEINSGVIKFMKERPDTDGVYLDEEKFLKIIDEYYLLRDWDVKTGWPERETLERLDLKDVADELEKRGLLP